MRALRIVASALVAVALVVAPAAAASALPGDMHSMADPPDFTPSPNKWKAWILNVTSSVLGGATPSGWRAEQIGNAHRYNWGWETLNAQFGYNSANPAYLTQPDTYADYIIGRLEMDKKGGTGGKPFTAPATGPKQWVKVAGGATSVLSAYWLGSTLGAFGANAVGGMFGMDANGLVCSSFGGDFGGTMVRLASGQDCSAWGDLATTWQANADSPTQYTGSAGGYAYIGTARPGQWPAANWWSEYCYSSGPSGPTSGTVLQARRTNGTWVNATPSYWDGSRCMGAFSTGWYIYGPDGQGNNPTPIGTTPQLRKINSATGEVIESMNAVAGNPDRRLDCRVSYTDGTTATGQSATYKESTGRVAAPRCPNTPTGKTPSRVRITDNQIGAPGGSAPGAGGPQTVYDEPVTDQYKEWWEAYPECRTGACKLDLIRVTPSPAVSCFDLTDGCVGWWEDPAKTEKYLCRYGVHDVDMEECAVYSGIFQPGRVSTGAPYSDPTTGQWSGGQASPRAGQAAMNATIQDPATARNCDLSDIGFDPIGWVMRPMQCWAEWAAVPRPVVAEVAFTGVEEVWAEKPPGVIAEVVEGMNVSGTVSGCSVSTTWHGVTQPIVNACAGPIAALAGFTRLASFAVMGVLVFSIVRRQIAGMVNYNVGQN